MKIVVALGGNALGKTHSEQVDVVKKTAKNLVDLISLGHQIIITHGNGPQVGMINNAFSYAGQNMVIDGNMPFAECGAMSQGYIGFHLEMAIRNELINRNVDKEVCVVITNVLVDKNDEAFNNPTKPIGTFVTKEIALKLQNETGDKYIEDSNRGYRKVVASPKPKKIIEINSIKKLINDNKIVICGGGGGIPTVSDKDNLSGIDAVIDKDFTSALIAEEIDADLLLILTEVDKVSLNYSKDNQINLDEIDLDDINKYIQNNEFGIGSMLPKIEACYSFVSKTKKQAIITSLLSAVSAVNGENGTLIKYNRKKEE